jgi:hypothetical protein
MKIAKIILVITIISLLSSICFASLRVVKKNPVTKKLRYAVGDDYIASFISSKKNVNYPLINKKLTEHFSQEIKRDVTGSIWENTKEKGELILEIVKNDKIYQGEIRISIEAFSAQDGKFYYRIGELHHVLETVLGYKFKFTNIRATGGNNLKKMEFKDDDFIIFEP